MRWRPLCDQQFDRSTHSRHSSLLNFEAATSHTITVRTTDQGGLTFDKAVTINLTNVNEAPTAVADTATANEAGGTANGTAGTNPTGNVLTNDTDVDTVIPKRSPVSRLVSKVQLLDL